LPSLNGSGAATTDHGTPTDFEVYGVKHKDASTIPV